MGRACAGWCGPDAKASRESGPRREGTEDEAEGEGTGEDDADEGGGGGSAADGGPGGAYEAGEWDPDGARASAQRRYEAELAGLVRSGQERLAAAGRMFEESMREMRGRREAMVNRQVALEGAGVEVAGRASSCCREWGRDSRD